MPADLILPDGYERGMVVNEADLPDAVVQRAIKTHSVRLGCPFVIAAAKAWDGTGDPPDGWIKQQLSTGRRRTNGDPAKEFVER